MTMAMAVFLVAYLLLKVRTILHHVANNRSISPDGRRGKGSKGGRGEGRRAEGGREGGREEGREVEREEGKEEVWENLPHEEEA